MHFFRPFFLLASLAAAAAAQSTITLESTAGVPATPNVGDGGTTATFDVPSTSTASFATTPSSTPAPTPSQTLTGAELSAFEASISTRNAQVDGMTGIGDIEGISSLGPGFAESISNTAAAPAPSSSGSSGRTDGAVGAASSGMAAWAGLGFAAVAAVVAL